MQQANELEKAVETLQYALRLSAVHPTCLLILGECYEALDQKTEALSCYRELFFWNASEGIPMNITESTYLIDLAYYVRSMGFSDRESEYWIPVYARVYGKMQAMHLLSQTQLQLTNQKIKEREIEAHINSSQKNKWQAVLLGSYLYIARVLPVYKTKSRK